MTGRDDNLDLRRRRAAYRALHRGTKEMDHLMSRYADAHLDTMSDRDLARFEALLALPDPELQRWILGPGAAAAETAGGPGPEIAALVAALRRFHGLAPGH